MKGIIISGMSIVAMIMSFSTSAQIVGCTVPDASEKKTVVYFANGVGTAQGDAIETAYDFEDAYESTFESYHADSTYEWSNIYNNEQGYFTDVVQVLQQKLVENGASEVGGYLIYSLIAAGLSNDEVRARVSLLSGNVAGALLTDAVLENLSESMLDAAVDASLDLITVQDLQISSYEADLVNGKRVIILAHSQGNLFTNTAVESVRSRQPDRADSIVFFGVASPSASNVGGAAYVTAHDDRIIDGLRLLENVLPSNIENDLGIFNDDRSWFNHYMIRDYFDSALPSRAVIDTNMNGLAQDTPFPIQIARAGALRASLTWGDEPDVDLHAYEPNGYHVYYSDKVGLDGELDVDDVNGRGPENYVVACDAISVGSYQIGVNYYNGSGPETAVVTLFLGDGRVVGPRQLLLESDEGRAGNDNPAIMFTVDVATDDDNNAVYSVR
jgi:hypothetical protein